MYPGVDTTTPLKVLVNSRTFEPYPVRFVTRENALSQVRKSVS